MSEYNMKNLTVSIDKIPTSWIYKHYYTLFSKDDRSLKLINQPFDGRTIKVKSIVNRDSDPSLCFYFKNGRYLWKDFSSGLGGDAIDFVAYLYNKFRPGAESQIVAEYEFSIDAGISIDAPDIKIIKKDYKLGCATFDNRSLEFWKSFKIRLETLRKFDVRQLKFYDIIGDDGTCTTYNNSCFGFFSKKGPYKIYQPLELNAYGSKYITIDSSYVIGSDQLEFKKPYCGIISGLKDIMAIDELDLEIEYVAPTSESSLLKSDFVTMLKSKYRYVFTMFDNDVAGIKAMQRYKKIYDIPYVRINLLKDLAENNKHHDLKFLRPYYAKLINDNLND